MTRGSDGATASAPMDATFWPSKIGDQVSPAFGERQTPPSTAPK